MNAPRLPNSRVGEQTIIHDDGLAGLAVMLGHDTAADKISAALARQSLKLITSEIRYVRYKPATSCIIGYLLKYIRTETGEEIRSYAYVKCYDKNNHANAAAKLERPVDTERMCSVVLKSIDSILYPVWADKELEGIELAFTPRKLARPLREGLAEFPDQQWRLSDKKLKAEIVRYKPERRAVVRLNTRVKNKETGEKIPLTVYARCYADDRSTKIGPLMTTLSKRGRELEAPVVVPLPISYLPEKKTLLVRSVAGKQLANCLDASDAVDLMNKTGAALRWLHSVEYENLDRVSSYEALCELGATAESLKRIMPSEIDSIEEIKTAIIKKLAHVTASQTGLMHGDFYSDQVLIGSVDQPIALIDFDRAGYGNQIIDLANFCADLRLQRVWHSLGNSEQLEQAFVTGYYASEQETTLPDKFETLVAAQMLKQVVAPFRSWDSNWQEKIRVGLDACREIIL